MLGGLFAVLSAAAFAFNNATVRRGVLTGSVGQAMAITVPLGVPIFFVIALVTGHLSQVADFSPKALLALSAAGIVHFVWGRYCNYRATRAIGTNLVAPIQQLNLVFALSLAIWLLGEELTLLRIVGIALLLLGPSFTLPERAKSHSPSERNVSEVKITAIDAEKPAGFKPQFAEGYLFAFLSATGYGVSPILVRLGLEGKGLGVSIAGGLVAYTAATATMLLVLAWPSNFRDVRALKSESACWFTASGVLICFSQMFLYMAMSIAPVTVVSPITRLSMLFRLYFSRWLNPRHEVFGGPVIAGTVVSLTGAVTLSLTTDVIASLVPLPDGIVQLLNWHWP